MNLFLRIATRNTLKNWRKSLAAIASIAVAFISLVLFQGYIKNVGGLYREGFQSRAMYGDMIIENAQAQSVEARLNPEDYYITKEQQDRLASYLEGRKERITTRVRFLPVTGTITNGESSFLFLAMTYDLKEGAIARRPHWEWDVVYGSPLSRTEDPAAIVLGQGLGFLMGCVPEHPQELIVQNNGYVPEVRPFHCAHSRVQLSTTTLSGQINALDFNIIGLTDAGYKEVDDRWIRMSLENGQALLNTDRIKFMSVVLKTGESPRDFIAGTNAFFAGENLPLRAVHWSDHPLAQLYKQTDSLLRIFQIFIVLVVMLIVGLSVFNTMVKNVKERTREIGMLRSLGYRPAQVMTIFQLETVCICALGIAAGLALSVFLTILVNHLEIPYRAGFLSMPVVFRVSYDAFSYLSCSVLLVVLSLMASHLSVRSSLKAKIAGNLTHV
ncbi:MAG: ABC transporter permease [Bdellovibrionaceae bacterium]|nr:ABC transporter permease [Pseudobdellovibrionaceae bacterium]